MTRMLCSLITVLLSLALVTGCSMFSSGDDQAVDELDSLESSLDSDESAGPVLDAEDELLAESGDLGELSAEVQPEGDDFIQDTAAPDDFVAQIEEPLDETSFEDEFGSAEIGTDSSEDLFSTTDSNQVDPVLADDELDEFSEFDTPESTDVAVTDNFDEFDSSFDETDPLSPVADVPTDATSQNQVTNLSYKSFENGGTVVIETKEPAIFNTIEETALNQIIIEVSDVFLPERFKRPYITKDFKQDIAAINAYSSSDGSARFVIQLKRPIKPIVQNEGSSILVMTSDGSSLSVANNEPPLDEYMSTTPSVSETTSLQAEGLLDKDQQIIQAFGKVDKSGVAINNKFSGEKISLEVTDVDVRSVIELIADKSGVNLIMDKEVEGKTSIRLREVPWDQALLVTLRSQGLGYVKQGNVLRIAKQETLSKEAQSVSNQIKSEKEAQLLSGGIKVKYIPVSYADVNELSTKLKDFLSEKGKMAFDDRTSSLVITDYDEYIERVEALVQALDTPPMQVEIESKLVEAREEFLREAGINWSQTGSDFALGGGRNARVNSRLGQARTPGDDFSLDLSLGTFDIFGDLTASLSLFERQDKIKVLSQPKIMTLNKVEAIIEQITQVPIQQTIVTPGAPPIITFNFLDLSLSLKVKPQITFKGDVILDVELKREFAGVENADGQRELNKRRAKTTTMIPNGKTAVIGGIYQLDDTNVDGGLPWLKNIPLLGYLFKSTRDQRSKNELLLFLKPKILREVDSGFDTLVSKGATSSGNLEELTIDEGSPQQVDPDTNELLESIEESTTDGDFNL